MAMCISAAGQAMPLSGAPHAQHSKAMRKRPSPSVAQPVMHPSAARPVTSAAVRPVRTQSNGEGQPQTRASAPDLVMILGSVAVIVTIIGGLQAILINNNSALNTKLDTNTASIRELKSEVNTKLDAISASVQAQQVQTANLNGQVTILRDPKKK